MIRLEILWAQFWPICAIMILGFGLTAFADEKIPRQSVLLDTDIGGQFDDALALSVLLTNPDIHLKAITTSGGDCEDRAWIVCRLLTMVGRREISVAWGRDPQAKAEVGEMYQYRYHPAVIFNRTAKPLPDKDAAKLKYEKLQESPEAKTTLLALGPLTNVARLLETFPDSKTFLQRIVLAGGQLQRGTSPEWNIGQDLNAAQTVLRSGIPLVIVPRDAVNWKLAESERDALFASQTMLTQQLQTLYQLTNDSPPSVLDAVAAAVCCDSAFGTRKKLRMTVDDNGFTSVVAGEPNAEVVTKVDAAQFTSVLQAIGNHGSRTQPRPLSNFSRLIERKGLPARVHTFEEYETDIERRWWLTGRLLTSDAPQGKRAIQSVLTLDFDDLQGDLKSMYSAVVFNPVPGPPMGPSTRLSFRYKLQGTDQLRVQLYSLTNGYHRYLALKDLPQDRWQEATVDMTQMRRPDGTGGPLSEDERIDDIQFYVQPSAQVCIDDVILYDAALDTEKELFPKRIVFTGWFDTGKQGKEWPGDYEIVEHEKPRKWKAAKSIHNKDLDAPWLRIYFRGARPIGTTTVARVQYRLKNASSFVVQLSNSKVPGQQIERRVDSTGDDWQQTSAVFTGGGSKDSSASNEMQTADELKFLLPSRAELLVDDVLVYEPGELK